MVRVRRQRRALSGFKVHDVVANGAAFQRERGFAALFEMSLCHAERRVDRFRAADRLEHEIDGRTAVDGFDRRRDVGQHTALSRYFKTMDHVVEQFEQVGDGRDVVAGRIDADDRVTAAVHQSVDDRRGDAFFVVGRMVRLQAHGHASRQPDCVAELGDDSHFAGREHEILVAHDLRYRGGHFRRHARRNRRQLRRAGRLGQQPIAKAPDGQVRNRLKRAAVMRVDNQPRDVVGFIGNDNFGQKLFERHVGQRHLGGSAFSGGTRCDACQHVARTRRRGLRQKLTQIGERIGRCAGLHAILALRVLGLRLGLRLCLRHGP